MSKNELKPSIRRRLLVAGFSILIALLPTFSTASFFSSFPQIVKTGARISIENANQKQSCRITVLDKRIALTAGHCGQTGSVVYGENNELIGRITENYLYSGTTYDAALIELANNAVGDCDLTRDIQIKNHEKQTLQAIIGTDEIALGNWLSSELILKTMSLPSWTTTQVSIRETSLPAKNGDSGAPVFNSDKVLIGIIQGGNITKGITNITPLQPLQIGLEQAII